MMRAKLFAPLLVAPLLLGTACRGRPSREDCDEAMEHYIDLAIADEPALASLKGAELTAARDMKRELRLGQPAFRKVHDACVTNVKASEIACAKSAGTTREWEACVAP